MQCPKYEHEKRSLVRGKRNQEWKKYSTTPQEYHPIDQLYRRNKPIQIRQVLVALGRQVLSRSEGEDAERDENGLSSKEMGRGKNYEALARETPNTPHPTIHAGQDSCATTTNSTTELRAISPWAGLSLRVLTTPILTPDHTAGGVVFSKVHNEGKATRRGTIDIQYKIIVLRRVGGLLS
jgi:hypothetical protein